jgi:hypothetical protein
VFGLVAVVVFLSGLGELLVLSDVGLSLLDAVVGICERRWGVENESRGFWLDLTPLRWLGASVLAF